LPGEPPPDSIRHQLHGLAIADPILKYKSVSSLRSQILPFVEATLVSNDPRLSETIKQWSSVRRRVDATSSVLREGKRFFTEENLRLLLAAALERGTPFPQRVQVVGAEYEVSIGGSKLRLRIAAHEWPQSTERDDDN